MKALITAAAMAILTGLAMAGSPPTPEVAVYHWDSIPQDDSFLEVFLVTKATGVSSDEGAWQWAIDGDAIEAVTDGPMLVGAKVTFDVPVYDFQRTLTAHVDGQLVLSHSFGGGAGTPI